MPGRWTSVVVGLVATALLLSGCSARSSGPFDVTLAALTEQQDAWIGRSVRTEGVVRTFDAPRHYWIEDPDLNRVELLPMDLVADLVGSTVRVTGQFTFRDDQGRQIHVEEVVVIDAATQARSQLTGQAASADVAALRRQ